MSSKDSVIFSETLYKSFLKAIFEKFPEKAYGFFISNSSFYEPTDFILFSSNVRNTHEWKCRFESYGKYFVDHDDAGFVATPEESWQVQKQIWAKGMFEVGVFHSHKRHPANFSRIDYEMHMQRCVGLWHLIVSLRNPEIPQIRIFQVSDKLVKELNLIVQ
jgi:proteasome lid subunit RPN8/RPN11